MAPGSYTIKVIRSGLSPYKLIRTELGAGEELNLGDLQLVSFGTLRMIVDGVAGQLSPYEAAEIYAIDADGMSSHTGINIDPLDALEQDLAPGR